ncbi:MAG: 3-deoxy-D-manno-octulosonic acid transferase [Planctomycetota bacterium]
MPYLLNFLFLLLLVIFSPCLAYAAIRKGKYRDGWGEKLLGRVPRRSGDRPCVWFHAVSVGEVNLLQPLLAELARRKPTWECVISTTTRTGFALARRKYAGYQVFYCPLDFTWAVRRAMRRVRPALLVLAELELWPNLIQAARCRGARVAMVNGRMSERSYRGYRCLRPFIRPLLSRLHLIAVQNEGYAERFRELGAPFERVRVTGSVKFDGAETRRHNPATQHLRRLWGLTDSHLVFLAGSTQAPEEEMALNAFRHALIDQRHARLILVPRHPERFDAVAHMLDRSGLAWQRRSQLGTPTAAPESPPPGGEPGRVLLVDVIGELGAWWGAAHIGFVGGSMGARGGQNMIEPAGYGVATCFGPHTTNFRDIVALLLNRQAAVVVHDEAELDAFLARCVREPAFPDELGQRAQQLVMEQQGATQRTLDGLLPLVAEP